MTPTAPAPIPVEYRVAHAANLETLAAEFAAMEAVAAETLIDSLATQAIALWRLDDATAWQRVKFRARLIRAAGRVPPRRGPDTGGKLTGTR